MTAFYGNATINTTGARNSRYLDVSNVSRSVTQVDPILMHFSWSVESKATAPLRDTTIPNQYAVTVQWQFRYAFRQVVQKKFNTTLSGDSMASGFDFSSDSSTGQTYAYADPSEVQVFALPDVLNASDFEGGVREWTMETWDVVLDPSTGISTLQAVLTAYTVWMPLTSISSKCVLPSILDIKTAPDFPT